MNHPTLPRLLVILFTLSALLRINLAAQIPLLTPASEPDSYVTVDQLKMIAAVRAADDERTAATVAAVPARLDAIFSDQLHYAHSSGVIDTKASYVDSLVSGRSDYVSFEYVSREFVPAGPGVVLMKGRAIIKAGAPGQPNTNDLNYLAVWREEGGKWRFLAWQSCKNLPAAPK